MLSDKDLRSLANARLKDAKALLTRKRYDGAAYLCGYAVEIALKARIVRTLKWSSGFPEKSRDFEGLQSFKTHDLDILLKLSGVEPEITLNHGVEWSFIKDWKPESRYWPPGNVTAIAATDMIKSAEKLMGVLL